KCRKELHGVPRAFPVERRNMPKTKKRPERPYGGVLCSKCMRETILEKIKA
ncbi:50S ribosomal protein L34e, partial [Candidatus Woesearchaeota archaeon]|nr:50S ribosomal protein L34e [Candidatus Woesearchaeota archaeon]